MEQQNMNKPNHLLKLFLSKTAVYCAVLAALFVSASAPLFAQSAEVKNLGVYYKDNPATVEQMYCNYRNSNGTLVEATERSFVTSPNPSGNSTGDDPWVSSALIEYDQPFPDTQISLGNPPSTNVYPNHCLSLCMDVVCTNYPLGASTYSIAFPLQNVSFDIVKYYNNKNIANAQEVPSVRTIEAYPVFKTVSIGGTSYEYIQLQTARCGSYKCSNYNVGSTKVEGTDFFASCIGAKIACMESSCSQGSTTTTCTKCWNIDTGANLGSTICPGANAPGNSGCLLFNEDGIPSSTAVRFCTAWDGNYEHDGEMGKSNGQFGFRGNVSTQFPGDQMAVDSIEFSTSGAYPGENQIPIQVDVTNVHTVRSTPSTVGAITKVSAQPYTLVYKLSKDADVRVAVFDASIAEGEYYTEIAEDYADGEDGAKGKIVRKILNWEPQEGEGMKGNDADKQLNVFASWDGRNENGLLMPAGNYMVSIQARSQDEWKGVDFSRAVTRQLSLDPLKLTDVQVTGLNKKSTAYATISYVPTEPSTVYWEIYTPGTSFTSVETDSSAATGTSPTKKGTVGSLVYRSAEQKSSRMNYTAKWDGTCQIDGGCVRYYSAGEKLSNGQVCGTDVTVNSTTKLCSEVFTKGSPLPDGNYIYVLWAEVPYNGCYYNALGAMDEDGDHYDRAKPRFEPNVACTPNKDGRQFTGAKTLKYTTGILEVERGLVGITIQPVSYSTVGSSPTAYGLDPFIFKYALDRDAQVVASVQNTAGVPVKYLTPQDGTTNVAQQLNTLSWDGRDEQGRMVTPGTYMFVVEAHDAMFPAVFNRATSVFPVDMYRVVDLTTTDVYGDSNAKATISYKMSKAMNVQVNIYNKDVVIPDYNTLSGNALENTVTATTTTSSLAEGSVGFDITMNGETKELDSPDLTSATSVTSTETFSNATYDVTWTKSGSASPYTVTVTVSPQTAAKVWPPRVCDRTTDAAIFTSTTGPVNASKISPQHACIYVNDTAFTDYPSTVTYSTETTKLNVRLQPIKTFDDSATKAGEGVIVMEEWDALYFYNPSNCSTTTTKNKTDCKYETVPDGTYPFFLSAKSDEAFNRYYYNKNIDGTSATYVNGAPFKTTAEIVPENKGWYATDKPVSRINITRGPVYFLDGSTVVFSNAPQLFNASTGPTFIPPYEINFAVSRASTVEIAIVALQDNVCSPVSTSYTDTSVNVSTAKNNVAGQICKFLSTMTIANVGNFDANTIRKAYWDGTDHTGNYVKPGIYEIRLTARNYPDNYMYQSTVKSIPVNADLFKVFDLLDSDSYAISVRDTDMHIGYQISVPMKVAIQIFKPGTTIYDYSKGTLRNPTTGTEVKDINEVLVRAIVGIRPSMTLIDEIWDGRDYAQQEVPDGTYPFRFVTALDGADMDTVTGEIIGDWASTDGQSLDPSLWKINKVADTYQYQNLHKATIAIGDGRFVCEDWEKTVFFYPNPLNDASKGTLEITKMPVPGTISIKYFNLAGDLVREGDYTCVDANNYQVQMGNKLYFQPDNDPANATKMAADQLAAFPNIRNAALRCKWDRTNQHGKKVAHGVYFGLVDFKAQNGREHCQKVVKIIVP